MSTLRKFSLPAVATIAAAGIFAFGAGCPAASVLPLPGIGGASDYVGADICLNCHREVHAAWSTSKHAHAMDALTAAHQESNPSCVGCHTTAYGVGGFVSMNATPKFAGVQCESCHGPGMTHVASRNPADINRTPLTNVCGSCHTGPDQPQFEEWTASGHSRSLADARNTPGAVDACLACHSLDYALGVAENEQRTAGGLPPLPLPVILSSGGNETLAHDSVGCSSCHAPHSSAQPAMLRDDRFKTCTPCHTDPSPAIGFVPHAPNWNILTGTGGQSISNLPGQYTTPLVGSPSVHSTVESIGGCGKCHGLRSAADPATGTPKSTGHRFEIAFVNCTPCHTPDGAESSFASGKSAIEAEIAVLRQRIASARQKPNLLGPDILRINAAELNLNLIEQDGSSGAHNMPYAHQLLNAADILLDSVIP